MTLCFSCLRKFEKKSHVNRVVLGPSTSENRQEAEQPQSSRMFCLTTRCTKERPVEEAKQQLTSKDNKPTRSNNKFSFGWRGMRRKSTTCSGGSTYDYIDAINDPVYSKVGEIPPNSHRYDYPAFGAYPPHRRPLNEPFYTSASQIYYMASDDPYSSIVSETRRNTNYELDSNSSVYDIGYEKMALPSTSARTATAVALTDELRRKSTHNISQSTTSPVGVASSRKGLDALYAKINRLPNSEFVSPKNDQRVHRQASSSQLADQSDTETLLYQQTQLPLEENESGSGSVGSFYTGTGSSQNPSYRYLTVREPVDIIRERIRRQEFLNEQQREADELFRLPHREHYYSTIANEYESVGGDERSSTNIESSTSERNTASNLRSSQQPRRHQVFRLFPSTASITSPLSLLTGRFHQHNNYHNTNNSSNSNLNRSINIDTDLPVSGQHNIEARPRPPTSPIPHRSAEDLSSSPNSRPVILSPTLPLSDPTRELADSAKQSSNTSLLTIRNYNDVISRPTAPTAGLHHNVPAQRNSYSYDSRTNATLIRQPVELTLNSGGTSRRDDTIIASMLTGRNRVSAPPNHPHAGFASAGAALIPPPLPPLPTPHGNVHLLRKAAELEEKDASNLLTSRISAFARNSSISSLTHRSLASTADVTMKASPKHVDHSQNVLSTTQILLA